MKWVGISGTWRVNAPGLGDDVRREVMAVLERGDGIVTGGALGVDFTATEVVLEQGLGEIRLQVIIPAPLEVYIANYRKRVSEGVVGVEPVEKVIDQLNELKRIGVLRELGETEVNVRSYYLRNLEVVKACDELLAFQVNASPGTQNTIEHAREAGMPVRLFAYKVLVPSEPVVE